jgi:FdhE protein
VLSSAHNVQSTGKSTWDQRIERAGQLLKSNPSAAEILNFYLGITRFQKSLYAALEASSRTVIANQGALPFLLPRFQEFLLLVKQDAPSPLSAAAEQLEAEGPAVWESLLNNFWEATDNDAGQNLSPHQSFLACAFLQPMAEYFAHRATFDRTQVAPICPFCARKPMLGVLRPQGDGAKRSLVCSLCLTEWDFRRILCPACGEADVKQLPIYTAAEFEHVRVEACDTCKSYIKTIDLTVNGLAVPVVDELASLPLTLWAEEKGYTKLQPNVFGM